MSLNVECEALMKCDLRHGEVLDWNKEYPTRLFAWNTRLLALDGEGTYYGYVLDDTVLTCNSGVFPLKAGMYIAFTGMGSLMGGKGIIINSLKHEGLFMIGGPIEDKGRLKYINGATDTCLIPPVKQGDPCMNVMYFGPNISQTFHTHPSFRVSLVISGRGEVALGNEECALLEPEVFFLLPPDQIHAFKTYDSPLVVMTFHPETDFGPSDTNHPMINKTIVNGISASNIPEIQTAVVSLE